MHHHHIAPDTGMYPSLDILLATSPFFGSCLPVNSATNQVLDAKGDIFRSMQKASASMVSVKRSVLCCGYTLLTLGTFFFSSL
jgi:hypothetical protein